MTNEEIQQRQIDIVRQRLGNPIQSHLTDDDISEKLKTMYPSEVVEHYIYAYGEHARISGSI